MSSPTRSRPKWTDELLDLAAQEATGRLVVSGEAGASGWLYLRDGLLCGVSGAARRPLLSRRLVAFGVLDADRVAAELIRARSRPGVRLVDLLVADRLASDLFIETYLRNSMAEQLSAMLNAPSAGVSYEPGRVQRTGPLMVATQDVLATALVAPHEFPAELTAVALSASGTDPKGLLTIHRAVRSASDGRQEPLEVAESCGLTTAEMIQVISDLRQAGALTLRPMTAPDARRGMAPPPPVSVAMAPPPESPPAAEPLPEVATAAPEDVIVLRPFAPAPVEPDVDAEPAQRGPHERREALSALKNLTEGLTDSAPAPPSHEPQAEVTTTAPPRAWNTRTQKPTDPMASGDVLRELKSLGE